MNIENDEIKNNRKILKRVIIVIAILSTYVMAFLLGRITNILTDETNNEAKLNDEVITDSTTGLINNTNSNDDKASITLPLVESTDSADEVDGYITLLEGNARWSQLEEINIFKNNFYQEDYTNKIAPGFSGMYEFYLENNSDTSVNYILSFEEDNYDDINIVYKVIKEDVYVLGNEEQSVYIDGVKLEQATIAGNTKTKYILKWKWEDTDYDTEIGQKDNSQYKLTIKLQATTEE